MSSSIGDIPNWKNKIHAPVTTNQIISASFQSNMIDQLNQLVNCPCSIAMFHYQTPASWQSHLHAAGGTLETVPSASVEDQAAFVDGLWFVYGYIIKWLIYG